MQDHEQNARDIAGVGNGQDQNPYGQEVEVSNNDSANQLANLGVGDEGAGYIGEFSPDYIIAEIFQLFDTDGSGKITASDLK